MINSFSGLLQPWQQRPLRTAINNVNFLVIGILFKQLFRRPDVPNPSSAQSRLPSPKIGYLPLLSPEPASRYIMTENHALSAHNAPG